MRAGKCWTRCVFVFALYGAVSLCSQSSNRPNNAEFNELVARAQGAMDADQVPEAVRLYYRATTLRPDWAEGWWHLGTLLFDSGRFPEAREAFAHFVVVERKQPGPGYGMLGLSEFHLKHYHNACAALERGIQVGLGDSPAFTRSVLYH